MQKGPRTLLAWRHAAPTDMHHQKLIKRNIIVIYRYGGSELGGSDGFRTTTSSFIWQVRIVTTRSCLEPSVLHSNAILVATRDRAGPTPPSDQPKFAWLYLPALPCWRAAIRDASSSR